MTRVKKGLVHAFNFTTLKRHNFVYGYDASPKTLISAEAKR